MTKEQLKQAIIKAMVDNTNCNTTEIKAVYTQVLKELGL